ncbi:hypothetical protein LCL97_14260 [Seohaeicola saemankumensis]|nr:hypothetical protein [Seohaeicola saemankumensis]MCA0871999.1 hypothetical protein [Seohaeicola saemankumensis]
MPEQSKVFTYQTDGLSYTVTVYEQDGAFYADIAVAEGAMDVNAVYIGDDDYSGDSVSLDGPLNMNGVRLDGETVQWDDATALSDPGLGPEGTEKETYVESGDTLTVELDIQSLDEVDIFGIRATSTTTEEGSIKAVSDDPEEPEPEEPTFDKLFFGQVFSDDGFPIGGTYVLAEEPEDNIYNIPFLPEGTEPTFENYLSYFEDVRGGDVTSLESVVFYDNDENGDLQELFRLDAPDGGFQSSDDLLAAYDDAIDSGVLDATSGMDLMAALSLGSDFELDTGAVIEDDVVGDEDLDLV